MTLPQPPRITAPRLPPLIASDPGENCDGAGYREARLSWTADEASAIGAEITDSRLARLPGTALRSRRLRLAEVEVTDPAVVSWDAPRSNWRGVLVEGGSIGVLDCSGARWDDVALRGVRIGYVNLREAVLSDVSLTGCRIDTLDLAGASTTRVALDDCRVEELDLRNRKGEHLDLRGLDVVRLNRLDGAEALAGVTITVEQARRLGPVLGRALGMTIWEEEP